MGMFAFRRLREAEALANAGASFSNAEPTQPTDANTKPKRRARVKQLSEQQELGQAKAD